MDDSDRRPQSQPLSLGNLSSGSTCGIGYFLCTQIDPRRIEVSYPSREPLDVCGYLDIVTVMEAKWDHMRSSSGSAMRIFDEWQPTQPSAGMNAAAVPRLHYALVPNDRSSAISRRSCPHSRIVMGYPLLILVVGTTHSTDCLVEDLYPRE